MGGSALMLLLLKCRVDVGGDEGEREAGDVKGGAAEGAGGKDAKVEGTACALARI